MAEPAAAPVRVPIQLPTGELGSVDASELRQAEQAGARALSEGEARDLETKNSVGDSVEAGVLGAARGATLGASDWVYTEGARAFKGDAGATRMAEELERARRVHGGASLAGEVAGSFLLPGVGELGEAKALAEGAGLALEARTGSTLLGRMAAKGLAAAVPAAAEGAMVGAGQELSDAALGDHELTAEKLLAGSAKGALLGFGVGSLFGAAEGVLAGGKALSRQMDRAAADATATETRGLARAERAPEATLTDLEARGASRLESEANAQAFKATGAKMGDIRKLGADAEAQAERIDRIGQRLRDEGVVTATASKSVMAERVAAKVEEYGQMLGKMRAKLDTTEIGPSSQLISSRIREEVLQPLQGEIGRGADVNRIRNWVEEFELKAQNPSFEKLFDVRHKLDKELGWDKLGANSATQELRKVRAILEEEFTTAGEEAAKSIGGKFTDDYRLAKAAYADFAEMKRVLGKEVARGTGNRAISLTDTLMGGFGLVAGGPMGLAAALVNKGVREYGNQAASALLGKAAQMQQARTIAGRIDDAVERGVKALGGSMGKAAAKAKAPAPAARVTTDEAAKVARAVRTASPEQLSRRVQEAIGNGLADASPALSAAATTVAVRAATYLGSAAPASPQQSSAFQQLPPRKPSDSELETFARKLEAVQDPTVVLNDLAKGRVSRDQVEAVKFVYPKLFAAMQGRVMQEVARFPHELPYPTRIALSVLFEIPADPSMESDNILAFQKTFAQGASQQASGPNTAAPKTKLKSLGSSAMSGTSRLEGPQ